MKEIRPEEIIKELLANNTTVIDARGGGLILGASHDEGGIIMLQERYFEGLRSLFPVGVMEGGEFLMNPKATEAYLTTLKEINSYNEYFDPKDISAQDNFKYTFYQVEKGNTILVSEFGQMIINRNASFRYLHQLSVLNLHLQHEMPPTVPPIRYRDFMNQEGWDIECYETVLNYLTK